MLFVASTVQQSWPGSWPTTTGCLEIRPFAALTKSFTTFRESVTWSTRLTCRYQSTATSGCSIARVYCLGPTVSRQCFHST
eukprot:344523-Pleurochrysis_carterae.AAC.1